MKQTILLKYTVQKKAFKISTKSLCVKTIYDK